MCMLHCSEGHSDEDNKVISDAENDIAHGKRREIVPETPSPETKPATVNGKLFVFIAMVLWF